MSIACRATATEYTCTKLGVDSSSRFPFKARTNRQTNRQTRLNALPTPAAMPVIRAALSCRIDRQVSLPTPTSVAGKGFQRRLDVCLTVFFSHDISKTTAARITQLDTELFQHESVLKNILFFGSKNQQSRSRCTKSSAGIFEFT